jgi:hypothetical protein
MMTTIGARTAMFSDTSLEIAHMQAKLLSGLSSSERLKKAVDHSQFVRDLSRRAIAKANPQLSELEQRLLFVEIQYGRELANRLRTHLTSLR